MTSQKQEESMKSVGHTPTPQQWDHNHKITRFLDCKRCAYEARCVNSHQALLEAVRAAHKDHVQSNMSWESDGLIKEALLLAETEQGK